MALAMEKFRTRLASNPDHAAEQLEEPYPGKVFVGEAEMFFNALDEVHKSIKHIGDTLDP
jgi:hypothetical protein